MSIASTSIIYPGVTLADDIVIEDFCIIGCPPHSGEIKPTVIESGSTIRSHTVIYSGNLIGTNFETGHKVNIRENNTIGKNVSIGTHSVIEHSITIEDNVRIHSQAFIPEFSILEEDCWIGPNVVLTNSKYPRSHLSKNNLMGPKIQKGAIIGANVTVLPGVVISEKTLIGAGSVICFDTEAFSVYVGNPAKLIKRRDEIKDYE